MLLWLVKGLVGFGEEFGDLLGEVLGAGAGQACGGDYTLAAAPKPDEPGASWGPSAGAGGAGIDLHPDWWHGHFLGLDGLTGVLGCGQDREGPLGCEGKLL